MMIYLWGKNRHRRKPIQLLISIQLSTEKLCTMDVFLKLPEIKMSSYGPVGWGTNNPRSHKCRIIGGCSMVEYL